MVRFVHIVIVVVATLTALPADAQPLADESPSSVGRVTLRIPDPLVRFATWNEWNLTVHVRGELPCVEGAAAPPPAEFQVGLGQRPTADWWAEPRSHLVSWTTAGGGRWTFDEDIVFVVGTTREAPAGGQVSMASGVLVPDHRGDESCNDNGWMWFGDVDRFALIRSGPEVAANDTEAPGPAGPEDVVDERNVLIAFLIGAAVGAAGMWALGKKRR